MAIRVKTKEWYSSLTKHYTESASLERSAIRRVIDGSLIMVVSSVTLSRAFTTMTVMVYLRSFLSMWMAFCARTCTRTLSERYSSRLIQSTDWIIKACLTRIWVCRLSKRVTLSGFTRRSMLREKLSVLHLATLTQAESTWKRTCAWLLKMHIWIGEKKSPCERQGMSLSRTHRTPHVLNHMYETKSSLYCWTAKPLCPNFNAAANWSYETSTQVLNWNEALRN